MADELLSQSSLRSRPQPRWDVVLSMSWLLASYCCERDIAVSQRLAGVRVLDSQITTATHWSKYPYTFVDLFTLALVV
ncbi:MAG: hypothetical protein RIE73_24530 [Coleofasciculus sp. C1-SOL-03]|uniref:hypothetical protein n=1 Tax=Coleofasciculus sp. C1-SOL-03 TaxID=3069522 RepID=UPI0032FBDECA